MKPKNKFSFILLFLILLLSNSGLMAQLPDGTVVTEDYITMVKDNLTKEEQQHINLSNRDINFKLSVNVYAVNNELGNSDVLVTQINQSFNFVNQEFARIGVEFKPGGLQIIPEYVYGLSSEKEILDEIAAKYGGKDRINLFLVDTILKDSQLFYGFTYFPDDTIRNNIFLRKDCLNGINFVAQLGHFFGLLSTHEKADGIEYVDGSNCKLSGDFICDTDADPNIYGGVSDSCTYIATKRDPQGDYYVPSVANYMSESLTDCKCWFSPDQYRRMLYYLRKYRYYLK